MVFLERTCFPPNFYFFILAQDECPEAGGGGKNSVDGSPRLSTAHSSVGGYFHSYLLAGKLLIWWLYIVGLFFAVDTGKTGLLFAATVHFHEGYLDYCKEGAEEV